jgi:hypothetical protein
MVVAATAQFMAIATTAIGSIVTGFCLEEILKLLITLTTEFISLLTG